MTLVAIVGAALGFMVLIILHELGHFTAAKAVGMRVERFALFFPPLLLRKKIGETEYALGSIPAGGYVKISGMNPDEDLPDEVRTRAYYSQPVWKRVVVIGAGPLVNFVLAFVLLLVVFALIGTEGVTDRVGTIERGYPAQGVLAPGDRIVSVDGNSGEPEQLSKAISDNRCAEQPPRKGCRATEPVQLVAERAGRRREVEISPIYDPAAERTRLGFAYAPGPREALPLGPAIALTADRFALITWETIKVPARLFDAEKRKEITGIVGTYEITRRTILDDAADVVGILGVVSLGLAVINLFPFLPLDGGHIFWAIVEKVRRRPVPFSVMERAGVVGFMLVMVLFVIGFTNDIGRLTGEGFDVR
ncbi:MAG: site-2 protease family protein [Actinomycetota bacterium]|nr:site-2 protease family protein [Actinomycetota bacterium]